MIGVRIGRGSGAVGDAVPVASLYAGLRVSRTCTVVPLAIGPPGALCYPLRPQASRRTASHPETRNAMTASRTIVDKIWADHVVSQDPGAPAVLAVDLHLVHEVTSPQAFTGLRERGLTRPPAGPDRRDGRPLDPDHAARPADARPAGRRPDQPARAQLRRVRHPAPRHRLAVAGHRPRHRAAARPDPARA